jgi:hypothetical protein
MYVCMYVCIYVYMYVCMLLVTRSPPGIIRVCTRSVKTVWGEGRIMPGGDRVTNVSPQRALTIHTCHILNVLLFKNMCAHREVDLIHILFTWYGLCTMTVLRDCTIYNYAMRLF